ncbi:hypothetical protein PYW07_010815 [Mythimna separata]|uniref:Uncharacterized protein n=1 Tax=Mythimna separata TaxID=271217 RepID=A0AAD8DL77_MYTSE|nr:hypothetical protein PYW07_010815 [Mythimna separata]
MYTAQCVLGLIVLYVGCTHSWEVAISVGNRFDFYTNDTKTDTVRLDSHDLGALAYDEVHDILLYVDKQRNNDAICGYGISSKLNQCFNKRNGRNIHSIFFDPVYLLDQHKPDDACNREDESEWNRERINYY